jgi:hypothetical protein
MPTGMGRGRQLLIKHLTLLSRDNGLNVSRKKE